MWNKISPRLWFALSLSNKRRSSVLKLYLLFAFFPSFVNSGSFCAFYSILNIFFFRICFVFHFTFPWCVSTISLHFPAFWLFSVLVGFSSDVVFWLENNVFLLTKTIDIGAPQIEYSLWQVEAGCRLLKKKWYSFKLRIFNRPPKRVNVCWLNGKQMVDLKTSP